MIAVDLEGWCKAVMTDKLTFRWGDLIAIGLVAVIAVSVMLCFLPFSQDSAAKAQIYLNGELIKTVSLDENQKFKVEGQYSSTIAVKDGAISFTDSNCPGQDCVHSGSIDGSGRSLVCLPNRVEIRVVSDESDVDFVAG